MFFGCVMSVGNSVLAATVFGSPLPCTGGAFAQFPFVVEQVFEIAVGPFGRRRSPRAFQSAGDRVGSIAGAVSVFPTESLEFNGGAFRFGADVAFWAGGTMGFPKCCLLYTSPSPRDRG